MHARREDATDLTLALVTGIPRIRQCLAFGNGPAVIATGVTAGTTACVTARVAARRNCRAWASSTIHGAGLRKKERSN